MIHSPDFLLRQRWFRAKARRIENTEIEDVLALPGTRFQIVVIRVDYAEGDPDKYVLMPEDEREFRDALLAAIARNSRISGRAGDLTASHTNAFPDSDLKIESFVSQAEQSNTSLIYGNRFILKLFRKIEAGINPDLEIGKFLTEHSFRHTPAVMGQLEYLSKEGGEPYAVGILQQFVPNQGDAWKYTLESLNGDVTGYADSARLLGTRTAQMHAALTDAADPDFAPEPFTPEDGRGLYDEMLGQADITFDLLRHSAAEHARALLGIEHQVRQRFAQIRDYPITATRIRCHGDFHLGQVLYTGSDFMIIDFEGEPARPLAERRRKTLAMRDVAGMLRSFQYASYSARAEANPEIESCYLRAYFETAKELPFVPAKAEERRLLLDAFQLQKALYEVAYELNNRPDWVRIPIDGILTLMS
ncbi:MAG: phosphotransferase [Bryobacteraceae bacterium]